MKLAASILTSYYNGERFLETFLKNFKEQTLFSQTELVFVGCLLNDNERFILNQFKKENPDNIKLIELKELQTQSECWNLAIKESSADYLCIWNIDDIRMKDSVENQYNALKNNNLIDCVYGMFIISNKFNNREGKLIDHGIYSYEEHKISFLLGPFYMFRKSFCKKNNVYYDEQLKVCSDFSFSLHLANKGKIKMINSIDGYFLDEKSGLSTRGDNIQPIERTLLEVKWEINHKIDSRFLPFIEKYDLNNEKYFGKLFKFKK